MDDTAKDVVKNDEEQEVRDSDADTKDVETRTVEDTDADTRDIEDTQKNDFAELREFMEKFDARLRAIESSVQSVKDAQSVVIDNGAVIRDDSPQDDVDDYVDTRSISELDLSI